MWLLGGLADRTELMGDLDKKKVHLHRDRTSMMGLVFLRGKEDTWAFILLSVEIKAGHYLQTRKAGFSETELASSFISNFPASTAIRSGFYESINGISVRTANVADSMFSYFGGPSKCRSWLSWLNFHYLIVFSHALVK